MKIRQTPYFFIFYFDGILKIIADTIMTIFLAIFFIVQMGFILYLRSKISIERNRFQSKLKPLEEFMIELNNQQIRQTLQLQLSDDLKIKMKEVNAALNKNIFELNYQLTEDLYPKKEI